MFPKTTGTNYIYIPALPTSSSIPTIFNMTLSSVENTLVAMDGEHLHTFSFPLLDRGFGDRLPAELQRELCYNITELAAFVTANKPRLPVDQLARV